MMEGLAFVLTLFGLGAFIAFLVLLFCWGVENRQNKQEKEAHCCRNCKYCKAIVYDTCYCDKETETNVPSYCRLFERK